MGSLPLVPPGKPNKYWLSLLLFTTSFPFSGPCHVFCGILVPWPQFSCWVGKIAWRRHRLPIPVFLGLPSGSDGNDPPVIQETCVWSQGWEDPLEEGMATTPVFLPGESPWTEEPGGLQSMGSQRVGHDWATRHSTVPWQGIKPAFPTLEVQSLNQWTTREVPKHTPLIKDLD